MEKTVHIVNQNKSLFGILHLPVGQVETVVLMVVGGPQTRVGSHRFYVQLARYLADRGLAVFRFDYQGIGDSEGPFIGFEGAGASIKTAIDYLYSELSELKSLVLWSLCDGAAASAIYASTDKDRIHALVLANPWVETEEGQAQTVIKHYYKNRLLEKEFWSKVLKFDFNIKDALTSFIDLKKKSQHKKSCVLTDSLPIRVLNGLVAYGKKMHFLISGKDITGLEFLDYVKHNEKLLALEKDGIVNIHNIADSDHTFSSPISKQAAFSVSFKAIQKIMSSRKIVETNLQEELE